MVLASGTHLGSYEILGPLGKGGMGEVYRAKDTKLGREVAIKVLASALADDPERLARFEREAKVLASLNHPNIATIYGLEESAEGKAIAMELVEGATLKSGLPLPDSLRLAVQIAEALEAAHERGVTHRDLKPANVMVTPAGLVKVLDFGMAAVARHSSGGQGTDAPTVTIESGIIMGTPAYMSPEQAVGHPVDKRSDIWSFGMVLWEMLVGKTTFGGDTVPHILENVIRSEIDFKVLPETTPAAIVELLKRCLDRDVRARLRDIGEARVTIQKYLANPVASSQTKERVVTDRRGLRLALGWGAVATVVALGVGFIHLREAQPVLQTTRFQIPLPDNMSFGPGSAFALSPDGRKLVFMALMGRGMTQLWIRSLDSLDARPLPETVNPGLPFWSPDSRFVAFASGGKLKKVDISGGPPQTICDWPSFAGGAWNRDNVILLGTNRGVMRVPASGGTPSPVTSAVGRGINHAFPVFLPDGKHFIYLLMSGPPAGWGLFLGSLDKKPQEQSTQMLVSTPFSAAYQPSAEVGVGQLLFLRESTLLGQAFDEKGLRLQGEPVPVAERVGSGGSYGFFSASQNGSLVYIHGTEGNLQLTWYDRKGQVAGAPGEPGHFSNVKVSPDGTKAIVARTDGANTDLWLVDLMRGSNIRFTFDPAPDGGPVWSPDGSRVAWNSNRGGNVGIYVKSTNGSGSEELLYNAGPRPLQTTDWTPDGKFILYQQSSAPGNRDIWALPVGEGSAADRKPIPIVQTPADESGGFVSPDNKWFSYISTESGRQEVYVQAFAPSQKSSGAVSGKWVVSKGSQGMGRWRADGRELLFLGPEAEVLAVDVTPGSTFQYGLPHLLFQLPQEFMSVPGTPAARMDVTRDNQRFLLDMPVVEKEHPEFIVVEMTGR